MAINPETLYPGQIIGASPQYPYGKARNVSVPGDGTGTPYEENLVNDLFGFQQSLLSAAGITPTGTPDYVGASQYLDALQFIIDDSIAAAEGINWTAQSNPVENDWRSVAYGNGLFVAVSGTGTGNRVMTSPDGINWTIRTSAADNNWYSITYGNGLFVAVSSDGTGNRVMTSPDGITWTIRTSAADNTWKSIVYGNGLFVAVSSTGTGNRVMTSPDGISWTIRTSAADNNWESVTYGNGLFVAVAYSGTGNRVMTSPDGISWTIRVSAADNDWQSVRYGNGLFVAVSSDGTGNRVMTSPDGISWTIRVSAADNDWQSVTYGNGLFVAVSSTGTGNRVMTSPDGISWTIRVSAVNNNWNSIAYGNGLFVTVAETGTGNRVMTSGQQENQVLRHDNKLNGGLNITGNVAVGNTIENWDDLFSVIEIGGNGSLSVLTPESAANQVNLSLNAYNHPTTGWTYQDTDEAAQYSMKNGEHKFRTAVSGTADTAITWVEAVWINNVGNVGIGNINLDNWDSTFTALQIGEVAALAAETTYGGVSSFDISQNSYWDGTNYKYQTSNQASLYQIGPNDHTWWVAGSGTAGNNITWTQALHINNSGDVYISNKCAIGLSSASAQLHVDQSSASGAIPTIRLEQADPDQDFMRFVGDAAAATLTNNIVAEADVTTATRQGFLKIYIQDDGNQVTDGFYFIPFFSLV